MTIKQQGGIFGRNPTFNNVTIDGSLSGLSDLNISGDLIVANGQGIDFSATSDGSGTTTSELFDDYEEGTFTPTLAAASGTLNTATGHYTKIGNVVNYQVVLEYSGTSDSSNIDIRGWPFTPKSISNGSGAATIGRTSIGSDNWYFSFNSSLGFMYARNNSGTRLTYTNWGANTFWLSGFYYTD